MSVFTEPLAQAREALAIAWPEGDHAEPNAYTEILAALDLIEQRAEEQELTKAVLVAGLKRRASAAEQRAADMEKALRKRRKAGHNDTCDFVKAFDPPLPCSCGHDEMCAVLSAREEAQ